MCKYSPKQISYWARSSVNNTALELKRLHTIFIGVLIGYTVGFYIVKGAFSEDCIYCHIFDTFFLR